MGQFKVARDNNLTIKKPFQRLGTTKIKNISYVFTSAIYSLFWVKIDYIPASKPK